MASMDDVKVGKRILVDGQPYEVIKSEHLKVAMGKGMEKCMIINLLSTSALASGSLSASCHNYLIAISGVCCCGIC